MVPPFTLWWMGVFLEDFGTVVVHSPNLKTQIGLTSGLGAGPFLEFTSFLVTGVDAFKLVPIA